MARIRTIKPDFYTSEQIMELRPLTRLTFIGMWSFCDDHGVHPASLKTLKAEIYPADDITASDLEGHVTELMDKGLLVEYSSSDRNYWHVTGWERHQKIDRPTYKYPFPYEQNQIVARLSSNNRRMFDERSSTEWNGMEWNGEEKETTTTLLPTEVIKATELPDPSEPETSSSLTIHEFRAGFQEATGQLLPGGCNAQAAELCRSHPRPKIEEAFRVTAMQGGRTLKYVVEVLSGKPRPEPRGRDRPSRMTLAEIEAHDAEVTAAFLGGVT